MVWGPSPHDTRSRGREARDERRMRPRPRRPSRCPSAGDLQGERTESGRGYGGLERTPLPTGPASRLQHGPPSDGGVRRARSPRATPRAGPGKDGRQGQACQTGPGLGTAQRPPAGHGHTGRGPAAARGTTRPREARPCDAHPARRGEAVPRSGSDRGPRGPITRCLWRVESHLRCPKPGVERGAQGEGAPGAIKVAVLAPGTVTGARGSSGARQRTSPRQHFTSVRHT